MADVHFHDTFPLASPVREILARLGGKTAKALTSAEQSHRDRVAHATVTPEVQRDIGIAAEDATGVSGLQSELPFFMQTGFGRR